MTPTLHVFHLSGGFMSSRSSMRGGGRDGEHWSLCQRSQPLDHTSLPARLIKTVDVSQRNERVRLSAGAFLQHHGQRAPEGTELKERQSHLQLSSAQQMKQTEVQSTQRVPAMFLLQASNTTQSLSVVRACVRACACTCRLCRCCPHA